MLTTWFILLYILDYRKSCVQHSLKPFLNGLGLVLLYNWTSFTYILFVFCLKMTRNDRGVMISNYCNSFALLNCNNFYPKKRFQKFQREWPAIFKVKPWPLSTSDASSYPPVNWETFLSHLFSPCSFLTHFLKLNLIFLRNVFCTFFNLCS